MNSFKLHKYLHTFIICYISLKPLLYWVKAHTLDSSPTNWSVKSMLRFGDGKGSRYYIARKFLNIKNGGNLFG